MLLHWGISTISALMGLTEKKAPLSFMGNCLKHKQKAFIISLTCRNCSAITLLRFSGKSTLLRQSGKELQWDNLSMFLIIFSSLMSSAGSAPKRCALMHTALEVGPWWCHHRHWYLFSGRWPHPPTMQKKWLRPLRWILLCRLSDVQELQLSVQTKLARKLNANRPLTYRQTLWHD